MKKLLMHTVAAAFLAVGIPAIALADNDGDQCSVRTLRGRYVFSASGFTIVSGVAQPKALIEIIDFNGDGTLTVAGGNRSVNGVIFALPRSTWTYTVAEDCSGRIVFDGPAFNVFVSRKGDQLWMIQTNPNSVFEGSATRTLREPPDQDPR